MAPSKKLKLKEALYTPGMENSLTLSLRAASSKQNNLFLMVLQAMALPSAAVGWGFLGSGRRSGRLAPGPAGVSFFFFGDPVPAARGGEEQDGMAVGGRPRHSRGVLATLPPAAVTAEASLGSLRGFDGRLVLAGTSAFLGNGDFRHFVGLKMTFSLVWSRDKLNPRWRPVMKLSEVLSSIMKIGRLL